MKINSPISTTPWIGSNIATVIPTKPKPEPINAISAIIAMNQLRIPPILEGTFLTKDIIPTSANKNKAPIIVIILALDAVKSNTLKRAKILIAINMAKPMKTILTAFFPTLTPVTI